MKYFLLMLRSDCSRKHADNKKNSFWSTEVGLAESGKYIKHEHITDLVWILV